MSETAFQKQILKRLENMEKTMNYVVTYIEDSKLTEEERRQLGVSLSKVKVRDTSDFISWKEAKKQLKI